MRCTFFLFLFAASLSLHAQSASRSDSAGVTKDLSTLRLQIDSLDNQLIHILAERMKVCLAVGAYKKQHHVAVVQSKRYQELLNRLCKQGEEAGLTEQFVKAIMDTIHKESVRQQEELLAQ